MLRQIIVPSEENSTITIPPEFYGTEIEVLVYPSCKTINKTRDNLKEVFANHLYSFENYKFDRNEANNYE